MIEIERLEKTFTQPGGERVPALRGIDLVIPTGQFVTVIGTNGSGKSTLLNAIAGTFLPDSGRIQIAGEDVSRRRDFQRARHVARVFQNPFMGTAANMTIAENLHMAAMRGRRGYPWGGLNSRTRSVYREKVKALEMQLDDRLDTEIGSLSGGQRQAVTLLMSVMVEPKVLLL